MIENRDYYGTQIYGPDDHLATQALDVGKFAAKQVMPFAWQGGSQFAKDVQPGGNVGPLRQLVGGRLVHEAMSAGPTFGLTPAAKYLSTSSAEDRAQELEARLHAGDTRTQAEYEKSQAQSALRTMMAQNDPNLGTAIQDALKNRVITPKQLTNLREEAQLSPLERMAGNIARQYQMKGDPLEGYRALKSVWDKATPDEQQKLVRFIFPLYGRAAQVAGSKIGPPPKMRGTPASTPALSMAQ